MENDKLAPPVDSQTVRFPFEVIQGAAHNFTETYYSRLEVPREFLYMSFLTCLGSILSRRATIDTEIHPQPRLYTLLLGESADDRKSTAIKKTTDFFRECVKIIYNQPISECWGVGSAEGLASRLGHKASGGMVLLCYDEFKSFISKAKIKSSTLLPCVNSLFEDNRYENSIKRSHILITDGYLTMLAASTVQTYEAAWDKSFTDIGFNNRLFIVPGTGQRKYSLPLTVTLEEKKPLISKIRDIFQFIGEYREIELTKEGKKLFQEWYENQTKSIHSKRLDGYALRIMLLMAINRKAARIDAEIVSNAIELVDWQLLMRQAYDPIDADNASAKMEEKIRRTLDNKGPLTDRELKQWSNAHRSGLWLYSIAMGNLRREKEIVLDRKSQKWKLGH
uniref:DUF3987 domain-containing protein n=1 Tax=viral metagenome TaxID=1070528 RepID=A0A6M3LDK6_9ZZZZ